MSFAKSTTQQSRIIHILFIVIILLGVYFRFARFVEPRSFWLDECWVAYDISTRSLEDILLGQNFFGKDFPVSPMGFALVQKLFVLGLNQSEFAFRFFPFLCSVFSLLLFARLTREWFGQHWAACVALAFFAFNDPLIHFASEAKRYSTVVLVSLLILSFAPLLLKKLNEQKAAAYLFLAGTIMFFYLSPILWIAVIIPFVFTALKERRLRFTRNLIVFSLIMIAFYFLFHGSAISQMMSHPTLSHTAQRFFPANPLLQWTNMSWAARALKGAIGNAAGINPTSIGFVLFLTGAVFSFRRDRLRFAVFILPVLMSFVLALLSIYPFTGRFIIHIVPVIFLFIGESFYHLRFFENKVIEGCLVTGLAALLLLNPFLAQIKQLSVNHEIEANRKTMEVLQNNLRPQDAIFVNSEGVNPFVYYASILRPFPRFSRLIVFGETPHLFSKGILCSGPMAMRRDKNGFLFSYLEDEEIVCHRISQEPSFRGERTWLFLSHYDEKFGRAWKQSICYGGSCRDYFTGPGVSLTLYESNVQ